VTVVQGERDGTGRVRTGGVDRQSHWTAHVAGYRRRLPPPSPADARTLVISFDDSRGLVNFAFRRARRDRLVDDLIVSASAAIRRRQPSPDDDWTDRRRHVDCHLHKSIPAGCTIMAAERGNGDLQRSPVVPVYR